MNGMPFPYPHLLLKGLSRSRSFLNIHHFIPLATPFTSMVTCVNQSMKHYRFSFLPWVTDLKVAIVISFLFWTMKLTTNLSQKFFQDSMFPSGKALNQSMFGPIKVITNFTLWGLVNMAVIQPFVGKLHMLGWTPPPLPIVLTYLMRFLQWIQNHVIQNASA